MVNKPDFYVNDTLLLRVCLLTRAHEPSPRKVECSCTKWRQIKHCPENQMFLMGRENGNLWKVRSLINYVSMVRGCCSKNKQRRTSNWSLRGRYLINKPKYGRGYWIMTYVFGEAVTPVLLMLSSQTASPRHSRPCLGLNQLEDLSNGASGVCSVRSVCT